MTEKVTIIFNKESHEVPSGITVNQASQLIGSPIPTLCHHPYLPHSKYHCGVCFVKDENTGEFIRSCEQVVGQGMNISTKDKRIEENIIASLKKKLSIHPLDCENCLVESNCVFKDLLEKYGVTPQSLSEEQKESYHMHYVEYLDNKKATRYGNNSVVIDESKCIECYRCVRVCHYVQNIGSMMKSEISNDIEDIIQPIAKFKSLGDYHKQMFDNDCVQCGQCSFVCPAGAITINSAISGVDELLKIKSKNEFVIVAQTAPSVRITLPEYYGKKPGDLKAQQLVTALKKIGFDYVFDTNFTADLTIMEEGHELIKRIKKGGPFPMFTSCCPGWINMVEKHYPEFIENLSTCKSPQQMMGALIKKYWSKKLNINKSRVVVVSIMPCTAKKDECKREQMKNDVDFVLTTRECGALLSKNKVNPFEMEETNYDDPLGKSTGAAAIFGATGGVMEAALRTAYEVVVGKPLESIDFKNVRGLDGIKEATVDLNGLKVNIAVAHSGKNIRKTLQKIKQGKKYHFVECMMCPGGCIGGGGNPKFHKKSMLQDRINAIYDLDKGMKLRKSHENPAVKELYETFLQQPLGHYSHTLLHTHYTDRKVKKKDRGEEKQIVKKIQLPVSTPEVKTKQQFFIPPAGSEFEEYQNFLKFEKMYKFKMYQDFVNFKKGGGMKPKKVAEKKKDEPKPKTPPVVTKSQTKSQTPKSPTNRDPNSLRRRKGGKNRKKIMK